MEMVQGFLDSFFAMGATAYIVIGVFAFALVYYIVGMRMASAGRDKWLAAHPGAVRIALEVGSNVITSKEVSARVVSGEAAVLMEKGRYVIYAMPGVSVLEVSYTYTRPGVLHRTVATTWGPANVEIKVEREKSYELTFDKKEEMFKLIEK